MFEFMKIVQSILEASMAIKPEEHVLVIVDNDARSMWLGPIVTDVLSSMGAKPVMMVITPPETSAQEPPPSVAAAMKSVGAIFQISQKESLVHSSARKDVTAAGVRYYEIFPVEDLKQGISVADMRLIHERTENVAQRLTQASAARVTTPSGTDISLGLTGRGGLALSPMCSIVAGLPYYAEAAIAPVEGTAEGIIVGDITVIGWGYILRKPLRCTVKAGKVVDISGYEQDADKLRKIISTNKNADNIAELGIGTSHIIPLPMYGTRRDAARIGTAHIAVGRNNDIGGVTVSDVHLDILMDQAVVELDGHCVLREGELLNC